MLTLLPRTRKADRNAAVDHIILADGTVVAVSRANLAAAKAVYAAHKIAKRRVTAARANGMGGVQASASRGDSGTYPVRRRHSHCLVRMVALGDEPGELQQE